MAGLIDELIETLANTELDRDVNEAILDGKWRLSRAYLIRALENILEKETALDTSQLPIFESKDLETLYEELLNAEINTWGRTKETVKPDLNENVYRYVLNSARHFNDASKEGILTLVFMTYLYDVPLAINDPIYAPYATWRLKIGK